MIVFEIAKYYRFTFNKVEIRAMLGFEITSCYRFSLNEKELDKCKIDTEISNSKIIEMNEKEIDKHKANIRIWKRKILQIQFEWKEIDKYKINIRLILFSRVLYIYIFLNQCLACAFYFVIYLLLIKYSKILEVIC